MKRITIIVIILLALGGILACNVSPQLPDVDVRVPTLVVGKIQEERRGRSRSISPEPGRAPRR